MAKKKPTDHDSLPQQLQVTLKEFDKLLQEKRSKNGWAVTIECRGVWIVTIEDKETGKVLAETGSTSLVTIAYMLLCVPLEKWN